MFKSLTYLRYEVVILCLFLVAACLLESTTVIFQKITEFDLVETQRLADLEISKLSLLHLHEQKVEALKMGSNLDLINKLGAESQSRILKNFCNGFGVGFGLKLVKWLVHIYIVQHYNFEW